jgi:GTP cyclohydrolase II
MAENIGHCNIMNLSPSIVERLARARADLRMGVPVLLSGRRSVLIASAESVDKQRLADILGLSPDAHLVLTARRAETLKARAYDGDLARVVLPEHVDLRLIRALADPANDLMVPLKGPLECARGGDVTPHRMTIQLMKSAQLLPAAVAVDIENPMEFAFQQGLTLIPIAEAAPHLGQNSPLHPVVHARLPMQASEAGKLHIYRPENGGEEHYAIEIGRPDREKPVLARLHSACFTGDVLGSLKCDCGPQLNAALAQMGQAGEGVLLYMNQEGRGIGLANKMRAYSLQDQGFDTVEANHRLGFEDDERDFRLGADILRRLGFAQVRLLTNNPNKVKMMQDSGITVTERVPLRVGETPQNKGYLATKARKSGHLM